MSQRKLVGGRVKKKILKKSLGCGKVYEKIITRKWSELHFKQQKARHKVPQSIWKCRLRILNQSSIRLIKVLLGSASPTLWCQHAGSPLARRRLMPSVRMSTCSAACSRISSCRSFRHQTAKLTHLQLKKKKNQFSVYSYFIVFNW